MDLIAEPQRMGYLQERTQVSAVREVHENKQHIGPVKNWDKSIIRKMLH
ncbi:MAG: hypothetical protein KDI83_09030 [Gammaproteobacteria bacterium]|nr:hypothetical protein [Gammaproteobacteria bacterium]